MLRVKRQLTIIGTALVTLACGLSGPATSTDPAKPNIIVFLVDDLGWQDIAVPLTEVPTAFNLRYRTPNITALAAEGMKFTDHYAAAPVCTPTRTTLITGHSPAATHITNWTQREGQDTSAPYPLLLPPGWNVNGVSPSPMDHAFTSPLLPVLLREAGYHTIHVGKAHWGAVGTPGADPLALGFDVNIGGTAAGQPGSYLSEQHYSSGTEQGRFRDVPGLDKYYNTGTFLTEALTLEANQAIDNAVATGRPVFLHFAHFAVHTPIEADDRFMQHYLDMGLPPVEARYASLIEGVDKSVGDVLAHLDHRGLTDNTLVIYMSDNGGLAAHTRAAPVHVQNAPLRSGKGSGYEGGIRVPMIARWPGHVPAGSVSHVPTITDDIFPTLLEVAGVLNRDALTADLVGRSLQGLLGGADDISPDRPLLWHYPHFWGVEGPGIEPFSALRSGRFKLLFFYTDRRYELYDLDTDLGETVNLLSSHPADAARLSGMMRVALERAGAQLPLDPETREAVELPPLLTGR